MAGPSQLWRGAAETAAVMVGRVVVRRIAAGLVISGAGLAAIQNVEGNVRTVYLDAVGIPTVCVGHTGKDVTRADVGRKYSEEMCDTLLMQDSSVAQHAVQKLVKVPISQQQFDALVSLVFNIGTTNFARSTLLRRLNAGQCLAAAAEFDKWNMAGGRILPGLIRRRAGERMMFEEDCPRSAG